MPRQAVSGSSRVRPSGYRRTCRKPALAGPGELLSATVFVAVIPVDEPRSAIRISVEPQRNMPILVADGVLDSCTYRSVRDTVIEAALEERRAVIVDVNRLSAPAASAWTVFTSARWHVGIWPAVPILLVCAQSRVRRVITASGVTRYVPVHSTRELALDAVDGRSFHVWRRARTELPRASGSMGFVRAVVAGWLDKWDRSELIPLAATVATVFVENVLDHTDSAPALIVESYQDTVTVAVEDCCDDVPGRHEDADRGADIVSGLAIVAALCRVWAVLRRHRVRRSGR